MNDISNSLSADKWKMIGINKRAGMLVPLFCFYSKNSLGIGDFSDLNLVVDFAKLCANSIVQLLPMNELGMNFCPYDSLSSFALEPSYISFRDLSVNKTTVINDFMNKLSQEIPVRGEYVDYKVKDLKLKFLKLIFQEQNGIFSSDYKLFKQDYKYWLDDFCLFKVLKNFHNGLPWYEWPQQFKDRNPSALEEFKQENNTDLEFQSWLQWQLYRQFRKCKEYANKKGVYLKGDLPILVSRDSADVWAKRRFFKLYLSSGAPVDMYCAKGQRWGTPPYNWKNIFEDDYQIIRNRLIYAENFYDMIRLDHVVGLFRIWSIPFDEPLENEGINGFFDPVDESLWAKQGRDILSAMISSTKMLICAEDLGTVPEVCPVVLEELGIPGNDVQRWKKDWLVTHDFLKPENYRGIAVSMLSTHDTTNWFAWWEFEAGTVDERLFERLCIEKNIDFVNIKEKLFSKNLSGNGRLRWQDRIDSIDKLCEYLSKPVDELHQIVDMYLNSFREKEKLFSQLGLNIPYQEKCSRDIITAIYKQNLKAKSIFCIQTIIDILYVGALLKDKACINRINTPGVISLKNWSLLLPVSIEDLIASDLADTIKETVFSSGRTF